MIWKNLNKSLTKIKKEKNPEFSGFLNNKNIICKIQILISLRGNLRNLEEK